MAREGRPRRTASHASAAAFDLRCTGCSGPIGVYEPVWYGDRAGQLSVSGYRAIRSAWDGFEAGTRFYHAECVPA